MDSLRWLVAGCSLWLGAVSLAKGEVPNLKALFPAGGQAGSSFKLTANGRLEAAARLTAHMPAISFLPTGQKGEWQVTVAADATPGLHLVYAFNAEGASEPRWFSVGALPEMVEVEPNDEAGKPQKIEKLPVCVNARLEKAGDVDGFQVQLDAGQTLTGVMEGYALGSGVDLIAHVMDDKGVRLMTASDGRNLDPVIRFEAPRAGLYTVQVAGFAHPPAADVRFTGGAAVVYRLHLSKGAVTTQVFPPVVATSGTTKVERVGSGIDPKKAEVTVNAVRPSLTERVAEIRVADALLPIQVLTAAKAATVEKEPNETKEQATPIQVGVVAGRIQTKEDRDRYAITLKKGEAMQARVWSKALGLPLDAQLTVEGPDGKKIATSDDQSERVPDPLVVWTAAVDGVYQIVVSDLFSQGNAQKAYALEVGAPIPGAGLEVTLTDAKPLSLVAGKTLSLKVKIKRGSGDKRELVARVSGLPAGVYAAEVAVPEKGGEVELILKAAEMAPLGYAMIGVEVWTKAEPFQVVAAQAPLRGESLRGSSLLDFTTTLWLTVKGS